MSADIPDSPYAHWIAWLDAFAADRDASADLLVPLGDPRLAGYTADRITERYAAALAARAGLWHGGVVRDVNTLLRSRGTSLGPVLIDARRRLGRLRAAMDALPVTAAVRGQADRILDDLVARTQKDLEDALRPGRGGQGALYAEARRTPLTATARGGVDKS
jgi:hypothetical protein